MASHQAGTQSPPPERCTSAQIGAMSGGKGLKDGGDLKKINQEFLAKLPSNPKGPLDYHAEWTARKR